MLREIDTICKAQGVYPHAFLSGHAHNYQRYTRKLSLGEGITACLLLSLATADSM